jgi:hypothetical protein
MTNRQKVNALLEAYNKATTGRAIFPLTNDPQWRVWTRMDGCRYTELDMIKPLSESYRGAPAAFFDWLKSQGATEFGGVAGPFGSDEYKPAIQLGRIFFRLIGNGLVEWGDMARLRNASVWRHRGVHHETV